MSILNVPVKNELFARVVSHAQSTALPLPLIVEQALESYLSWAEFDAVLSKVHANNTRIPVDEAEAEITAAFAETRA
jgi:hypothetical protein